MQKTIELIDIYKRFSDGTEALNHIDLYILKNEFITLLGPSGCGKTTTLRMIAGFDHPTSGRVMFDNKDITDTPPYERKVNTVFQKYALFPHLNVEDNIAFGLRIKKVSAKEIALRVGQALELVNLSGYQKRNIDALSGGQQQRVGIARAIVNQPEVLLLDEPLGALDLKMRKEMQLELKNMQQELGITFVYVTHDQEEALTMSDTIVVMKDGRIQQIGSPESIYNEPKNAFVADFIGESNIIDGVMRFDCNVDFGGVHFECVDTGFEKDEDVDVVVRPEDIYLVDADKGMLSGTVVSNTFKGVHFEMLVRCNGYDWMIQDTQSRPLDSEVGLFIRPFDIHIMKKAADVPEEEDEA